MAEQWYFKLMGEELGPVPRETLAEMVFDGRLSADDEVREAPDGAWISVADARERWETTAEPQELHELSELNFEFVSAAPAAVKEPAALANLDELDFQFVDAGAHPAHARPQQAAPRTEVPAPPTRGTSRTAAAGVWFCRVLGSELGPLSLDELRALAVEGQLGPRDEVRSEAGDWVRAAAVPELRGLFPQSAVAEPSRTVSHGRAEPMPAPPQLAVPPAEILTESIPLLSDNEIDPTALLDGGNAKSTSAPVGAAPVTHEKPASSAKPGPAAAPVVTTFPGHTQADPGSDATSPSPALRTQHEPAAVPREKSLMALAAAGRSAGRVKEDRESLGSRLAGSLSGISPAILALAAFALLLLGVKFLFSLGGRSPDEDYTRLHEYYQELVELRARRAPAADWEKLDRKVKSFVEPMVEELEDTASAKTPGPQQLLFAARDGMLPMLAQSREKPGDAELRDFIPSMRRAHQYLGDHLPPPPPEPAGPAAAGPKTPRPGRAAK